jgi:hypothetical protein
MVANLISMLPDKALRLSNRTCIYCGKEPAADNPHTVEHVIGRRFVPKGSLHQSWALIANACETCNLRKSGLEDDISAITLLPSLGERHVNADLQAEAMRKATGSYSRKTKKLVAHSQDEHTIEGRMMTNAHFSANFISPPQLVEERVHQLAYLHLQGLYYMMSFSSQTGRGGFLPGEIGFVANANKPDWGNELMRGFANLIAPWPLHLDCICARGFFKARMRREAEDIGLWAFALEWNSSHRIVGFFGEISRAQAYVNKLPELRWQQFDATTRFRMEIPLASEDDLLFADANGPSSNDPEAAAGS